MAHVLILGVSGTYGRYVASALLAQGHRVSALMRDPRRLPAGLEGVGVMQGDVRDRKAVAVACAGVDIVVYGVNPPNYGWRGKAEAWLDSVAAVAEERGLGIVFPGNVYVFDPADGPRFDEQTVHRPRSSLGRIRCAMEVRLQLAAERGARVLVLRMGDFIAPGARRSWLPLLLGNKRHGWSLDVPGSRTLRHSWAYVPDAAEVTAQLLEYWDALGRFEVFHYAGLQLGFHELAEQIGAIVGAPVHMSDFPWWTIRLGAPFLPLCRGLLEMRYLWQEEVMLSDDKLRAQLGARMPETDVRTVLMQGVLSGLEVHAF